MEATYGCSRCMEETYDCSRCMEEMYGMYGMQMYDYIIIMLLKKLCWKLPCQVSASPVLWLCRRIEALQQMCYQLRPRSLVSRHPYFLPIGSFRAERSKPGICQFICLVRASRKNNRLSKRAKRQIGFSLSTLFFTLPVRDKKQAYRNKALVLRYLFFFV